MVSHSIYSVLSSALVRMAQRVSFAAVICFMVFSFTAWAQNVAEISGIVADPSGAGIAGAIVKFTQTDTDYTRTFKTETNGSYSALNLPIGPYTLEIQQA